jgi:hypothetical protein
MPLPILNLRPRRPHPCVRQAQVRATQERAGRAETACQAAREEADEARARLTAQAVALDRAKSGAARLADALQLLGRAQEDFAALP